MDARTGVWRARGLCLLLCLLVGVDGGFHNALVGPGALSTRGGGGGRGSRGYGRVDEFPVGFFVGGSSVVDMNGLYVRQDVDPMLPHATQLYYKNSHGWSINYVNAEAEGYPAQGGKDTEWLFVDPTMVDRFATQVTHLDCAQFPPHVPLHGRSGSLWGLRGDSQLEHRRPHRRRPTASLRRNATAKTLRATDVTPGGLGSLGAQGKSYLPGAGKSWAHLHRAPHSGPTGFRVGDHVRMRQGVAEYWELDARALVTAVTPEDKEVRPLILAASGATRAVLVSQSTDARHAAPRSPYLVGG